MRTHIFRSSGGPGCTGHDGWGAVRLPALAVMLRVSRSPEFSVRRGGGRPRRPAPGLSTEESQAPPVPPTLAAPAARGSRPRGPGAVRPAGPKRRCPAGSREVLQAGDESPGSRAPAKARMAWSSRGATGRMGGRAGRRGGPGRSQVAFPAPTGLLLFSGRHLCFK